MSLQDSTLDATYLLLILHDDSTAVIGYETEEDLIGGLSWHQEGDPDLVFRCYKTLRMVKPN